MLAGMSLCADLKRCSRGSVLEGRPLKAGGQITQALLDSGQPDLAVESAEDAHKGLEDGNYHFTITLPENFGEAIASPMSGTPQKPTVTASSRWNGSTRPSRCGRGGLAPPPA